MILRLLIVLALALGTSPALAADATYPPGSRIGLVPPDGGDGVGHRAEMDGNVLRLRDHPAAIVEAKAKRVAQAAREDFQLRRLALRIQSPDAGGVGVFACLRSVWIVSRLAVIRARATAEINLAVRALGDPTRAMIESADAVGIVEARP